jgi:hypothetical protein
MIDTTVGARRKPLAGAVVSLFALAAPAAHAAVLNVTDCGDSGAGTLRNIIATAADASSVDTSACSTITLSTGAIAVPQNSLTISGPAAGAHTKITAIGSPVKDRIFTHSGNLNFSLARLDIEYGRAYDGSLSNPGSGVNGGCIASAGNVIVTDASISHCSANSLHGRVYGGGIFASKVVWITRSTISANLATSLSAATYGGGVFSTGEFLSKYSTVSDNVACPNAGCGGIGGGVVARGGASITNSTISGNTARTSNGGVSLKSFSASPPAATVSNSTISGNRAVIGAVGGVYANVPLTVSSSTIAFNTAASGASASGLSARAQYASITVDLNGTLLSNNSFGNTPTASDFGTAASGANTIAATGADNLIFAPASGTVLPSGGGLVSACPLLGPLRGNGGSTMTHQLLSGSPAIDVGNDTSTATGAHYDQRGTGFPRNLGMNPDIGAFETDPADVLFNAGFDGCP